MDKNHAGKSGNDAEKQKRKYCLLPYGKVTRTSQVKNLHKFTQIQVVLHKKKTQIKQFWLQ